MSAANGKDDLTHSLVLSENGGIMFKLTVNSMREQELQHIPLQPTSIFFDHYLTMPGSLCWGKKGF